MSFQTLFDFESALAEFTGAPYVVVTDGCTHAIELCLRLDQITSCTFTPFTYISIPMLMQDLGIEYSFVDEEYQTWVNEYRFFGTNIWDSARRLQPNMYRSGMKQCLSFGNGKPLELGKAGAILLDNEHEYQALSRMRSDGRDLRISPWQDQKIFKQGYHYCPTLETCSLGLEKLSSIDPESKYHQYPDLRTIDFTS